MKLYIFRCSNKPDLYGVSLDSEGRNLPSNICSGRWDRQRETDAEPGDHIAGFVSRDLFRDLKDKGFHLASGVNVIVSGFTASVSGVFYDANTRTRFFQTDSDA
jgi:hypothetical protein